MVQYNVKDIDAAAGLSSKFAGTANEMSGIADMVAKAADDVEVLDRTLGLNEQATLILRDVATQLKKLVPGLEDAANNVKNIVTSAQMFAEARDENALGSAL